MSQVKNMIDGVDHLLARAEIFSERPNGLGGMARI